ncbi:MAG: M24 family metallopeptidase [Candidatus Gastranaerophilales bacterium]
MKDIRGFLSKENIDFLLVNSTNKHLVEYNTLSENSRYFLTNFSGSTGDALLSQDCLYLFVDGRYHIQADLEVDKDFVSVVKLQSGHKFIDEIIAKIAPNSTFAIVGEKNSQTQFEAYANRLALKSVKTILLKNDPFKQIVKKHSNDLFDLDLKNTGMDFEEKKEILTASLLQNEAVLITNLEDLSYLLNKRDYSKPFNSAITARALITKDSSSVFFDDEQDLYEKALDDYCGKIYVDKSKINAFDYDLIIDKALELIANPITLMKTIKNEAEINHYRQAFASTDRAVSAIKNYIETTPNLSEYDISKKLEEYYFANGAKNLSFNSIVAKNENSALAHYSKSSESEILGDGDLVLIDSGAFFEGGLATDITRVFVVGEADALQTKVYTTVLKMFLNAYNYSINSDTTGYDLDNCAREIYEKNKIDGFEFNHGLGHGIGVSVHEYPPNLSKNDLAKVKLQDKMCFTIEPGLYNEKHFGVRLENSCYVKDNKICSFVKMNFEKKLIDLNMLTEQENQWLKEFEVK